MNAIETTKDKKFLIRVSYIEIYNEEIRDLLSKDVKQKKEMKTSPEKGKKIRIRPLYQRSVHSAMCKYLGDGRLYELR